ncbi:MAG: hypothetical protein RL685_7144 [Pseudomonadota bacterium]|jgi:drug/metabolite transporter (DMT)-like permease
MTTIAAFAGGGSARQARGWACALGLVFCLAPGVALADGVLAAAKVAATEEESPAPMPFQLPAASASAALDPLDTSEPLSLSLLLLLLSGAAVGGTLSAMFRSLSQRDHAHPAPSQRW